MPDTPFEFSADGNRVDVRRDSKGRSYCGAKTRQGTPCKKLPILGKMRCKNHGGKALCGKDAPSYKDGRSSRYRKVLRLEELDENDVAIMDLRKPIQITDEMISRMAEGLEQNDSPAFRTECKALYAKLRLLMYEPDSTSSQIAIALKDLGQWIDKGRREDAAIAVIVAGADRLSAQMKRAWDVRTSATQVMNKNDAHDLMMGIIRAVSEICGREDAARVFKRVWAHDLGGSSPASEPGHGGPGDGQPRAVTAEVAH